jgi:hypothetical protein
MTDSKQMQKRAIVGAYVDDCNIVALEAITDPIPVAAGDELIHTSIDPTRVYLR